MPGMVFRCGRREAALMLSICTRTERERRAVLKATGESLLTLAGMAHQATPLSPAVLTFLQLERDGRGYLWRAQ